MGGRKPLLEESEAGRLCGGQTGVQKVRMSPGPVSTMPTTHICNRARCFAIPGGRLRHLLRAFVAPKREIMGDRHPRIAGICPCQEPQPIPIATVGHNYTGMIT